MLTLRRKLDAGKWASVPQTVLTLSRVVDAEKWTSVSPCPLAQPTRRARHLADGLRRELRLVDELFQLREKRVHQQVLVVAAQVEIEIAKFDSCSSYCGVKHGNQRRFAFNTGVGGVFRVYLGRIGGVFGVY